MRRRFSLFFVILACSPLLILGGTTLYLISLSHRHDVSNLETQLINQKIEEIQKFFADTLGVLELQVSTDQPYIDSSDQAFILEGLLRENQAFVEASFVNLRGKETEKRGRNSVGDETELFDISSLPKFKEAAAGRNFIGDVYHAFSGSFITLASAVRNKNGEVISVLSAEVSLDEIARSIEFSQLGSSGYLVLVGRGGGIIVGGRQVHIARGLDVSGYERVSQVLSGQFFDALGSKDVYESPFTKKPVVGSGKSIPNAGWAILVEWPLNDAYSTIDMIRKQTISLSVVAILGVLLLAPLFAERLTRPIQSLKAAAGEIEQGNFDFRVLIQTRDELEELGATFNKMSQGLKRLQELKNEFVFIAAHELRAPVAVIKGYLSMAFDKNLLSETLLRYLKPAYQANERLVQLINDLLEIARSEAGKLEVKVAPCDISEAIKAILVEAQALAAEKKISLEYQERSGSNMVLADQPRLKEVVMNFVSNAIKYNRENGWVRVYHEIKDKSLITHVEDNGFGMSPEDQKHMFEKFFRSSSVKIEGIGGTGLGLFITKELVKKMGGEVWFESEEGKGSRFSFSLPLA